MTDSFRLVMSQGPEPGRTFPLNKDSISLGRDPGNDIVIGNPQVSRQHARITRQGGLMVIEDLGSTNGTFVNGMRLTGPHTLANGDVIGLGDAVTLTYYGADIDATETIVGQPTAVPPPPSYTPPPPTFEPAPPAEEEEKSKTWLWVGCGCLAALILCGALLALVWYMDANYPDILYAPLRWLGF
ncbi:MAG TPA: FHA domain-containing protein [Thermoflexia bacterium]|nr:FHA domain-containing protein [Thermoflexia bacterium]